MFLLNFLFLLMSFNHSYYLNPDEYLDNYKDYRRYNIVNFDELTSQCFPIELPEYKMHFFYDSIRFSYLTGINIETIYIEEEINYQLDIPLFINLTIDRSYGAVGSGYLHFGHEGGKTDEQKIVGFAPGFEIPLENFYIYYQNERLKLEYGRNRVFWGPGNFSSLFLSDNLSYDMLRISYHGNNLHFENVIAPLDSKTKKYIAAQRIEISLFNHKLLFSINESVIWSNRIGEYYLIPVSPYYLVQRYYAEGSDNVIGGFDIQFLLSNKLRLYFQGMVDDVSFSPPEPPEKIGILLGGDIYDLLNIQNLDLLFEVSGVSPYTYSHYDYINHDEGNGYFRNDSVVGHELGNNFWDGKFEFKYKYKGLIIKNLIGYTYRGQENLHNPWNSNEPPNPPWPQGIVEKQLYFQPCIGFKNNSFEFEIKCEISFFENYNYQKDNTYNDYNIILNVFYQI